MQKLFVDSNGKILTAGLTEKERQKVDCVDSIVDFVSRLSQEKKHLLIVDRGNKPVIARLFLRDRAEYDQIIPNAKYSVSKEIIVIWQPWRFALPADDYDEIILINNYFVEKDT